MLVAPFGFRGQLVRAFPSAAAGWAALGVAAPDYIWPLQETSGNLVDTVAAAELVPTGTGGPDLGIAVSSPNRLGIRFDGTNQAAVATSPAFLDVDATTSLTFAIGFMMPTLPSASRGLAGKRNSAAPLEGYSASMSTAGNLQMVIDSGAPAIAASGTLNHADALPHGAFFVIDRSGRSGEVIRIHSDKEDVTSSDISGVGSLSTSSTFRLGVLPGIASSASEGLLMFYAAAWVGTALNATDFAKWWGSGS